MASPKLWSKPRVLLFGCVIHWEIAGFATLGFHFLELLVCRLCCVHMQHSYIGLLVHRSLLK